MQGDQVSRTLTQIGAELDAILATMNATPAAEKAADKNETMVIGDAEYVCDENGRPPACVWLYSPIGKSVKQVYPYRRLRLAFKEVRRSCRR